MNALYETEATAHGAREGRVSSADGIIDLQLVKPKRLGGDGSPGANPETLFACGYAACFEGAVRFVIGQQKLEGVDVWITAKVGIGRLDIGGLGLEVTLTGRFEGIDAAGAEALMQAAHQVCPYSRATRGNIEVTLQLA
jgi:Ohr subfamily peroxiredoxin